MVIERTDDSLEWQYGVEFERTNKIEPELMAVVLGYSGLSRDIVISYPGEKVDAGNLGLLTRRSPTELGGSSILRDRRICHPSYHGSLQTIGSKREPRQKEGIS